MSMENPEEENNNIWDRMFVISGAQEIIRMPVKAENEQISVRPSLSDSDKYAFELGGKLQYENVCTGDKEKMQKHNLDICTYGNTLTYFGPAVYNMTFEKFWLGNAADVEEKKKYKGFIGFINEQLKKISSSGPVNFYLGTHHNRLKKTIFQGILDTDNKKHFANCCCIKMSKKSGQWQIKFVFEGFPDKPEGKDYFKNTGNPFSRGTEGIKDPQPLIEYLSGIQNDNVNIYIIRHGNAFHNAPLRLVGKTGMNRPLDSCLTPLGIIQGENLGKDLKKEGHLNGTNVWCTSYMNRAMLTILQVMKQSDGLYQRLEQFRKFYIKYSMAELYKRLVKDETDLTKWNENINKLIESSASRKIGRPTEVQEALNAYMSPGGIYFPQKYFNKQSDFKIADIVKMKFPPKFTFKSKKLGITGIGTFGTTSEIDGGRKKRTRKRNKLMCPKNCCGLPVIKCGCPETCPHCNCQEIKRLRRLLKRKTCKKRKKKTKKRKRKKSTKKKARNKYKKQKRKTKKY